MKTVIGMTREAYDALAVDDWVSMGGRTYQVEAFPDGRAWGRLVEDGKLRGDARALPRDQVTRIEAAFVAESSPGVRRVASKALAEATSSLGTASRWHGRSACEIIRWLGANNFDLPRAKLVLVRLSLKASDSTLKIQLAQGRKQAGVPEMSAEDVAHLRGIADGPAARSSVERKRLTIEEDDEPSTKRARLTAAVRDRDDD